MRLSCPEQMLGSRDLAGKVAIIEQCGFDGIDVRFDTLEAPESVAILQRSALPLVSVFSQIRSPSLLEASAQARATAVADVVHRARVAASHGARNMILVPVFGPTRLTVAGTDRIVSALETAILVVSLKEIAEQLGETPITVVLEPLNHEQTHFLTVPAIAAGLCQELAEPRIATMVDTYHCFMDSLDGAEQVLAARDHLALMHFSDADRKLPGEGEVDFAAVINALKQVSYDGWAGWECRKIETTEDIGALAQSVTHIRELHA